jgi:hypothetical protein
MSTPAISASGNMRASTNRRGAAPRPIVEDALTRRLRLLDMRAERPVARSPNVVGAFVAGDFVAHPFGCLHVENALDEVEGVARMALVLCDNSDVSESPAMLTRRLPSGSSVTV